MNPLHESLAGLLFHRTVVENSRHENRLHKIPFMLTGS
jgi:hypothetical protein